MDGYRGARNLLSKREVEHCLAKEPIADLVADNDRIPLCEKFRIRQAPNVCDASRKILRRMVLGWGSRPLGTRRIRLFFRVHPIYLLSTSKLGTIGSHAGRKSVDSRQQQSRQKVATESVRASQFARTVVVIPSAREWSISPARSQVRHWQRTCGVSVSELLRSYRN